MRTTQNVNQIFNLHIILEILIKIVDSFILDIIETGQIAKESSFKVISIGAFDAAMIHQPLHTLIHQIDQILIDLFGWGILESVIGRVLDYPPEQIRPGEIIYAILLVQKCFCVDLGVHVIVDLFQ